jgi:hypothetical protein
MFTPFLAAALALQAAPAIPAPPPAPELPSPVAKVTIDDLPIEQAATARCAVAYVTINRWQKTGDARGVGYPDAEKAGGREFFVRAMARLMDDAALTRDDIAALALDADKWNDTLEGAERLKAMMPACELMKSAAGL